MVKAVVSQTDPLLNALSLTEVERRIFTFFFFSYLRFLKEISVQEHHKAPDLLAIKGLIRSKLILQCRVPQRASWLHVGPGLGAVRG